MHALERAFLFDQNMILGYSACRTQNPLLMNRKRKIFRITLIVALCISVGASIFTLGMYAWGSGTPEETALYKTLFLFAGSTFLLTLATIVFTTKKRSPEEVLRNAPGKCEIQKNAYR